MTAQPITFGRVIRYATLPSLLPRVRDLFGSGFGSFAFFIALVYRAVRLLPDGHPYLNPANLGRFGVVSVVTEAFRYVKFNRFTLKQRNIDQFVVFGVVLLALLLLVVQFVALAMALVMPAAMAFGFPGGASFSNPFALFQTPVMPPGVSMKDGTSQNFYDLSFIFLDRVFGVPGIFNSCIANVEETCVGVGSMGGTDKNMPVNDPPTFPWPYHRALHQIFQFYSVGLLVVAVFLIIYFTIVVVAETAQTGTPFGKRFNTVWAPLRLVVAAGLLIPLSTGLNAGQYLVLYSAKWGANFASNGWIGFNQTLQRAGTGASTPVGEKSSLIARPGSPDPTELLHFLSVAQACMTIENNDLQPAMFEFYKKVMDPRLTVHMGQTNAFTPPKVPYNVKPYLVRNSGNPVFQELTSGISYVDAVQWSGYGDVVIRFGVQEASVFKSYRGTVRPYCGEITIPTVVNPARTGDTTSGTAPKADFVHQGAAEIMANYWQLLQELVLKRGKDERYFDFYNGAEVATDPLPSPLPWNINTKISQHYYDKYMMGLEPCHLYKQINCINNITGTNDLKDLNTYVQGWISTSIALGQKKEQQNASNPYALPADLMVRGWAGAGIWYNRIADMNGTFTTAAFNLPRVSKFPETMEYLATKKQEAQQNTSPSDIFNPMVASQKMSIVFERGDSEGRAANVYWQITNSWQGQNGYSTSTRTLKTGNVILDMINVIFGTSGLFSIRDNANVHPLAQLSSIGKALIERSIGLMGIGLVGTALQPWIPENLAAMRSAMGVISGFAFSILVIGASAGFILFYIIPFLPFIYFFFAVAGWVKAIFEAMVGVPLWALAHIRIDGEGLPGEAASSGYYLILEIMIRPILIVFGLVASVTIYAASVQVLNDIFDVAVANVGGVDMKKVMNNNQISMENVRGTVDVFFYMIMYVILVYMLGMSSFKLIDLIPGSMLRWIGSNANAFTDSGHEAAGQLVSYGTIGSNMVFGQLSGAAQKGVQGISQSTQALAEQAQAKKPGG